MKRLCIISTVAVLSSGWVVPLYFSVACFVDWLSLEITKQAGHHSFPFLRAASQAWFIAAIWFGAAVLFWAAIAAARCVAPDPGRESDA